MRILVTGGAGRLGSEVVKLFSEKGYKTVVFDLPQAPWEAVENIPRVEVFKGDITNSKSVMEVCKGVDGVLHFAAILPPKSEINREITHKVNIDGTRNILDAIKPVSEIPIIFASSVACYGITAKETSPIREVHPLKAHNNYSESKIKGERIVRETGMPHVILRIAPISVVDLIELPDVIPYKDDQRIEFLYVKDAARALLAAFENPRALMETYNVAGGSTWQVYGSEYIEKFYDALGVDVAPNFLEDYSAIDWYNTNKSSFLGYQKTTFNVILEMLRKLGEELGLR